MMIKKALVRGIRVTIPLLLTLLLTIWVFKTVEAIFGDFLKIFIPSKYYYTGMGALFGVVLILSIGVLINAWIVRRLYDWLEKLLNRIPLVKTVYQTFQEVTDMFGPGKGIQGSPVIVEYQDLKFVGFVTRESFQDLCTECLNENLISVYLPMSYQIGGFTMMIPKHMVKPFNLPMQDAMKYAITAGITQYKSKINSPVNPKQETTP